MNRESGTLSQRAGHQSGKCPICGGTLKQTDEPHPGKCAICGKKYESRYQCENGCQFCEDCYAQTSRFSHLLWGVQMQQLKTPQSGRDRSGDTAQMSKTKPIQRELGECPICGGRVNQFDEPKAGKCDICGEAYDSYYQCENDCQFCDSCYGSYAFMKLGPVISTKSKNPIDIINGMMSDESFGLRGCIHCAAAPLSVIMAFRNTVNFNRISSTTLIDLFKAEITRTPISLCKKTGMCGIAIACGNSMANILLVVDDKYKNDPGVAAELKAECLKIAEGICTGHSCCKQIAYKEILKLTDFISGYLRVQLQLPEVVKCSFCEGNPYCDKENCEYYAGIRVKRQKYRN